MPHHYQAFLTSHHAALAQVEHWLIDRLGTLPGKAGCSPVQRLPLLSADLAALGCTLPAPLPAQWLARLSGTGGLLGVLYVIEGSRKGAAVLRRRVPPGTPCAYLSGRAHILPWNHLCEAIDAMSEAQFPEANHAAQCCFQHFLDAAVTFADHALSSNAASSPAPGMPT
ncbi:biliverdin-producing heme oxygenase [Novosphingobium beihaiensis]|uniref:Biliverdin-producing heme oxygenase n=1 Tax=Novosphingobium beihaiensis TaxID=2930389 RepID=A0ABT0BUZ3_9SPHN|nr:biliverdin-producing heme oxygenase [Novosphingobium beihaiensis]MCJ2188874.1 biliverdin-producing heme oxygenase [Novosphingobium beihaiensis]